MESKRRLDVRAVQCVITHQPTLYSDLISEPPVLST